GADGRLAEGDHGLGSDARERLPDADGHGGLAVAGGGGGDRGGDHELAVGVGRRGARADRGTLGLSRAGGRPPSAPGPSPRARSASGMTSWSQSGTAIILEVAGSQQAWRV